MHIVWDVGSSLSNGEVPDQCGRVDKCVRDLWTVHLTGDHKASLLSRP